MQGGGNYKHRDIASQNKVGKYKRRGIFMNI